MNAWAASTPPPIESLHTRCHYAGANTKYGIAHASQSYTRYSVYFCVAPAIRIVLGKLFVKYKTKCLRLFKWICIKFESMGKDEKVFLRPCSVHSTECTATFCFLQPCTTPTSPCLRINFPYSRQKWRNKLQDVERWRLSENVIDDAWPLIRFSYIFFFWKFMKCCCRQHRHVFFRHITCPLYVQINVGKSIYLELNRSTAVQCDAGTADPIAFESTANRIVCVDFSEPKYWVSDTCISKLVNYLGGRKIRTNISAIPNLMRLLNRRRTNTLTTYLRSIDYYEIFHSPLFIITFQLSNANALAITKSNIKINSSIHLVDCIQFSLLALQLNFIVQFILTVWRRVAFKTKWRYIKFRASLQIPKKKLYYLICVFVLLFCFLHELEKRNECGLALTGTLWVHPETSRRHSNWRC